MQKISIKKQIVFYSVPLALLLLLAELLLALTSREQVLVKSADPDTIYSLYPNRRGIAATPEYRALVSTDSKGFRYCPGLQKHPGTSDAKPTLLILGDSFAEGWGVACKDSFAGWLERELPSWKIQNAGVHGASPVYFVLRARKLLKTMKPKVLLVQIFDNDLDDLDKILPYVAVDTNGRIQEARPPGLGPIPAGWLTRKIRELAIYRTAKRAWHIAAGHPLPIKYYKPGREPKTPILSHAEALQKFGGLSSIPDLNKAYNGQFAFYRYTKPRELQKDKLWKRRFRLTELYLKELIDEVQKRHPYIKIVFFYVPAKEVFAVGGITGKLPSPQTAPKRRLKLTELRKSNAFYQMLARLCTKRKLGLIDGLEVFYNNPEDLYFPGDAHLNPKGHRKAAEAIAASLQEL